jgi:hypothetical protein
MRLDEGQGNACHLDSLPVGERPNEYGAVEHNPADAWQVDVLVAFL